MSSRKSIAIIGGGAAALSLASFLDGQRCDVTIYERNKGLGRKFLVAGKGGFNLTHSESIASMVSQYSPLGFLDDALLKFDNETFREWLRSIGIPTYIGSSRRVFPEKGIKPIEVLSAIRKHILHQGHEILYGHQWTGWSDSGGLIFNNEIEIVADIVVFCLGGGSWKVTGSDGEWSRLFLDRGVNVNPFVAANCAYAVNWKSEFISKSAGSPLKNIAMICNDIKAVGEAMITEFGIEGSAVYALTNPIQHQLENEGNATITLDLKPMIPLEEVKKRLFDTKRKITDALAKDLKLEKVKIRMLKSVLSKEEFLDVDVLSLRIKSLSITVEKSATIDEAISTTGGVDLDFVDENYQLKKIENTYVIGEMLDWNGPTGGYLLQACFSMGHKLAKNLSQT